MNNGICNKSKLATSTVAIV